MTFVARLQPSLDHVEIRGRPEQAPRIADDRQQREADDPARPEAAAGVAGEPYAYTQRRDAQRPAGLLQQTTTQLGLALTQCDLDRRRADRQVDSQGVEVGARGCRIGPTDALLELLRAEPAGAGVLAKLLDQLLTIGVRDAQAGQVAQVRKVSWSCTGGPAARRRRGACQIPAFSTGDSPE
jgi:hypothetical protein